MDYETKILPHLGGYGRYNRVVVIFSWFPAFAVTLNLFSGHFFTLIPDTYHCRPDPSLLPSTLLPSNFSEQSYLNLTIPWDGNSGLSHCELFKYPPNVSDLSGKVPRERVSCTRGWEYSTVAGLQSNIVTDQMDGVYILINAWACLLTSAPPLQWDLVCNDYWKIPLQHICFMVGWIVGYIFLGTLCDWLGRQRGFLLSVGLSSLCGVIVCLSRSLVAFLLILLFNAVLVRVCLLSGLELCDPPNRLMVAMVGGFVSVSAELLLPGLAVLCRDWPVLQAVATVPLLLLLSYWCCASVFPESPRWLLATDQIPKAKKSFQEFASRNGVYLQDETFPTVLAELDSTYGEDCRPRFYSVLELRRTRVIWKNCLILSFTLFIGTGIQYCFTRNLLNYSKNFYFTYFLRVITGALACIFICLSVNHFGRRGMLLLSAIITGLSSLLLLALTQCKLTRPTFLTVTVFSVTDLHDGLVLVLSVVGLLFSQALSMLSAFFACEVMPTVVRGGCLGLVLAAGCVGMAASSLMELQSSSGYFLHHVIFASFAVLSVLCIMLLPESKRKSLPDSLKEGESQRRPPLFLSRYRAL
uniref:Solute carrier family 22 member 31 n=1 Tax=Oryzias melastigma TaxID=30732 RepID=A0A3B3DS33_ORYME